MVFYYFLALLAAFCWSLSSLISADITRVLGGIGFNRLRLIFVSFMLLIYATFQNTWITINIEYLNAIIVSGVIGVFLGDTLLFTALQRIGPRRNNILFSLAAPFAVILNIVVLHKNMSFIEIAGCILIFIGVVIAITYGNNSNNNHRWELIEGSIKLGILFGTLAALCQAIGLIIMKPVLDKGADPIASAAIRTTISAFLLSFTYMSKNNFKRTNFIFSIDVIIKTTISGFLGMALGMSLLLIALKNGDAGIVTTLSSTSPIMILFLLWIFTKKIPVLGAWVGTLIAIIGTGLIFIN
jgi:drug/metabolite transporter (DMT)-like permease